MGHKRHIFRFLYAVPCLLVCQALFGTACSSDKGTNRINPDAATQDSMPDSVHDAVEADTYEPTRAAILVVSPNPVEAVELQAIPMTFRAYDAEGHQLEDQIVTWRIEDTQVAAVDESGLLSALEAGETNLLATSGDAEESVEVTVLPIDVIERIEIFPAQEEIGVGERLALNVKGYTGDNTKFRNLQVDWQSDAPETASIDAQGSLVGLEPGEVRIQARLGELEAQAQFRVELKFDALDCSAYDCLAVSTDGKLYSMGPGDSEQITEGLSIPVFKPVEVDGDIRFKSVYRQKFGEEHFCALSMDDRAYCWGNNTYQRLGGDRFTARIESPTAVNTELRFETLGVGSTTTCGLTFDGALFCWGNLSIKSSLPIPGADDASYSSIPVLMDARQFSQFIMSGQSLCAQTRKERTWHCMGQGVKGELGNGGRANQDDFVAVAAPSVFTSLAAAPNFGGGAAICGVDTQQQIWCWGKSIRGEFGQPIDPGAARIHDVPERTAWDIPIVDISELYDGFCGVTVDHEIRCWGNNAGCKLGRHSATSGTLPDPYFQPQQPVEGIPQDWETQSINCVLTEGGDIWCWGLPRHTEDPSYPRTCEPVAQRIHTF